MSNVRDSIARFCRTELDIRDAKHAHKMKSSEPTAKRTRAHSIMTRLMLDTGTPWLRVADNLYLHQQSTKSQVSLSDDLVFLAATRAVEALRNTAYNTVEEARSTLLELLKRELRHARTELTPRVTVVKKLPRGLHDSTVPPAPAAIQEQFVTWMQSKRTIQETRERHKQHLQQLNDAREEALRLPGVREYITALGTDGQLVALAGHGEEKFKLRRYVSVRRNPVREFHIQEALERAVTAILRDAASVVHARDLADHILNETYQQTGTTTTEVFSLSGQRGRKVAESESEDDLGE